VRTWSTWWPTGGSPGHKGTYGRPTSMGRGWCTPPPATDWWTPRSGAPATNDGCGASMRPTDPPAGYGCRHVPRWTPRTDQYGSACWQVIPDGAVLSRPGWRTCSPVVGSTCV